MRPLGHFKKEYEERDVSMDKDPYNSLLVVTSCERKQSSVCNDACLPASIGSSAKITKELLLWHSVRFKHFPPPPQQTTADYSITMYDVNLAIPLFPQMEHLLQ